MKKKNVSKGFKLSKKIIAKIKSTKQIMNYELYDTIRANEKHHNSLVGAERREKGIGGPIDYWLGCKRVKKGLPVKTDKTVDIPNQSLEIDGDEDEINFIQNQRMADIYDVDGNNYQLKNQLNSASKSTCDEYDYFEDGDDDFQLQRHQRKRNMKDIQRELKSQERMSPIEANAVDDIWKLSNKDCWRLYRYWIHLYLDQKQAEIADSCVEFAKRYEDWQAFRKEDDLAIVRKMKIIGMTTTGAAKYCHIMDDVEPKMSVS